MTEIINKTMDRADLLTEKANPTISSINELIKLLYSRKLHMASWYGTLPEDNRLTFSGKYIKNLAKKVLGKKVGEDSIVGADDRGMDYKPLPDVADDNRIPWYLYWEIFWVMQNGPEIKKEMCVLDAGGTSSLFTCYLASLGCEVHSIDLNKTLVSNGRKIAKAMDWNMLSYEMDMQRLKFKDKYFDHAYSICVFEHLDYKTKQIALLEIARCLKPGGVLSITFDYRNPAPTIAGYGMDIRLENQLETSEDITKNFLATGRFELLGNQAFYDNGKSYLVHPEFNNAPYTFGGIFLKRKK